MITETPVSVRTNALQKLDYRRAGSPDQYINNLPEKEFVIWFTARTGSTWLASVLFSAGFPKLSEYFHPNKVVRRAAFLGVNSWQDYVRVIKSKRTVSGLFGHEMTFQFWDMLRKEGDVLKYLDFSGPSVVLFREDIVLQAISIFFATNTDKWHRYAGTDRSEASLNMDYDEKKIRSFVEYIFKLEDGLRRQSDQLIRHARFLSYEQLVCQNYESMVEAIFQQVGFKPEKQVKARSFHTKMGSPENEEMRARFMSENWKWVAEIQEKRAWLFTGLEHSGVFKLANGTCQNSSV